MCTPYKIILFFIFSILFFYFIFINLNMESNVFIGDLLFETNI